MRWLKRGTYGLLALIAFGCVAYWWLLVESHKASAASYAIDIAKVRQLSGSLAGDKPKLIKIETVGHLSAPQVFVVSGDGWKSVDLPVSSYELVYGDHFIVVDTAFDGRLAKSMSATEFDNVSYARVSRALGGAALILVTHEHPDHVGGLLAQPTKENLMGVARLTREQVAVIKSNLKTNAFAALHLPSGLFDAYRPLDYDRYLAIAPGVVLIKAPGHTPGSQMIYVRRADGVEFLFLGDVAWQMRNVETVREKARLVTWMAEEDRNQVRKELAGLAQLHERHPELHMVPGHDAGTIASYLKDGLLVKGF